MISFPFNRDEDSDRIAVNLQQERRNGDIEFSHKFCKYHSIVTKIMMMIMTTTTMLMLLMILPQTLQTTASTGVVDVPT